MENLLLALLPQRRLPVVARYAATAAIIGATFGLRLALEGVLGGYPLLLFIPGVFLSALLFDKGSGFFATGLSAVLAARFFMTPPDGAGFPPGQLVPLGLFVGICCAIAAVTEALRQTVDKLTAAEQAKGLLLRELAHRTKNDLAMVASVLSLQARGEATAEAREALEAAIGRVRAIATAQERLRGEEGAGRVEMGPYLEALCGGLGNVLRDIRPVAVRVHSEPIELNSSEAVAVGLIVNELVTNAFKYAFPDGRGGAVDVGLQRHPEGLQVSVRDDGVGCRDDAAEGLGSRLVRLLARQLNGAAEWEPAEPGCRVRVLVRPG